MRLKFRMLVTWAVDREGEHGQGVNQRGAGGRRRREQQYSRSHGEGDLGKRHLVGSSSRGRMQSARAVARAKAAAVASERRA